MKPFLLLFVLLFYFAANAQKTIITGTLNNPKDEKIVISYQEGAALFKFKDVKKETLLDSAGNFIMELQLDAPTVVKIAFNEIYYEYIGQVGHNEVYIYLEPGNELKVDLSPASKGEPVTFIGKGAENNNFYAQFYHLFNNNFFGLRQERLFNASANGYLLVLDSIASAQMVYYNANAASLSPDFKFYITNKISYQTAFQKLMYPGLKKMETKQEAKLPADYYSFLKNIRIQNDSALHIDYYVLFVNALLNFEVRKLAEDMQWKDAARNYAKDGFELSKMYFTGKTRNVLLASLTNEIIKYQPLAEAETAVAEFKNIVNDKELTDFVVKHLEEKKKLVESELAPQFTLKDAKGKDVSLSDFKGKIVYLAFWASWCPPCKYEIPYTLKLQEKFKGKDVVFLYVSVDESEEMWKKAISSHFKGKGIHLNSKKSAENIQEKYNVDGPPRYILIDRNGKLIDDNANRPSDELTAEILTQALKL